jgi:DNA-binding transcriptional regulator YiaG
MPTPDEIRAARLRLLLTQRELALALGLSGPRVERTVQDWEAGRRKAPAYLSLALRSLARRRRK